MNIGDSGPREGVTAFSAAGLSATVQKSDRDETFGFFERPTKARIVEA
jgi:hypothetical protein